MQIFKKILDLLRVVNENKELISTIQHILLSFPEAVIIWDINEKHRENIVKFVNKAAQKELLVYDSPLENPIDEELIDFKIWKVVENVENAQSEIDKTIMKFSEMLALHQDILEEWNESEINSNIEILPNIPQLIKDEEVRKSFNLKSIRVCWNKSNHAYMHCFIDTTSIK